jgi:hypothetical protein
VSTRTTEGIFRYSFVFDRFNRIVLMSIATFCFLGFSYALWTLGGGEYSWSQIGWYLLEVSDIWPSRRLSIDKFAATQVYFGLDATGFRSAYKFHRVLGPILMVCRALLRSLRAPLTLLFPLQVSFACLANTLLLTVLVAILSNTFAHINADAAAESMFRRAVSTLEYVKAGKWSKGRPIELAVADLAALL